jgi:FkbM family methyltransferase
MGVRRRLVDVANRALSHSTIEIGNRREISSLRADAVRSRWQAAMVERGPSPESVPRGQLGQDLFALWTSGFARNGYFVEVGAADGVMLSNTLLLERSFGWNGIVVEAARGWHTALCANRTCTVDTRCVWSSSGESLSFIEPTDPFYGTVEAYSEADGHAGLRRDAVSYAVATVSLNDLLDEHAAPTQIDYVSIDTEGTEPEILEVFAFDRYDVKVMTIEHGYESKRRDLVRRLMARHGFTRVFPEISQWDDWFVADSVELPSLP